MIRIRACGVVELEPGESMTVSSGVSSFALFRSEVGDFYATQDSCTHEQWSLGEDGDVDGAEVVCPLHMARFDLASGKALCLPATEPLRTFLVEIINGEVFITLD